MDLVAIPVFLCLGSFVYLYVCSNQFVQTIGLVFEVEYSLYILPISREYSSSLPCELLYLVQIVEVV